MGLKATGEQVAPAVLVPDLKVTGGDAAVVVTVEQVLPDMQQ